MSFRARFWSGVSVLVVLLLFLLLSGCSGLGSFAVTDAWAREPAPSGLDTVVYATVFNHTSQERKIVGAESADARAVEMHEMKLSGDVMSMGQVLTIRLPANGRVDFSPAGYHLMVFRIRKRPAPGDTLNMKLILDDGTLVTFPAKVRANE